MGIPDHLTCLLRNLYAGQEATVKTRQKTMDWFQNGKGVRQGCILSPSYLTYMQSISCEMLGWMKHKLESTLPGEISITSDIADDTTIMAEIEEELKRRVKNLKLSIQKTKIMVSGPITSWPIDGKTVETVANFIFRAPKSLQMVIAAMKLKDVYSLEGKL